MALRPAIAGMLLALVLAGAARGEERSVPFGNAGAVQRSGSVRPFGQPAQRSPLSLDQALAITEPLANGGFAPPPHTIADITAILDQQAPDPARVAAAAARAEAPIPDGASPRELVVALLQRAQAACQIGRDHPCLADLQRAAQLVRPARDRMPMLYVVTLRALAAALDDVGGLMGAARARRELVGFLDGTGKGSRELAAAEYGLVAVAAQHGQFKPAQALLAKLDQLVEQSGGDQRAGLQWWADRAHGVVLDVSGRAAQAQRLLARVAGHPEIREPSGQPFFTIDDRIGAIRQLAQAFARQGRFAEAEVPARRALLLALKAHGRESGMAAGAVQTLGEVLGGAGRYADAERLLQIVLDTDQRLGFPANAAAQVSARADLAAMLVTEGRWREAQAQFDRIRAAMASDAQYQATVGLNLNLALADLHTGHADEALQIARRRVEQAERAQNPSPYAAAMARAHLALAEAATGDRPAALRDYQAAIPVLLKARPRDADELAPTAGIVRVRALLEGYLDLLGDRPTDPAAVAAAFQVAEAARAGAVQYALAESAARAAIGNPELADLARREQDAAKQADALVALLAAAADQPPDQQDAAAMAELRSEIGALRTARATLRQTIGQRFPDYAQLTQPHPATLDEARAALHSGEALIAVYVGADRSFVWAVPAQGPVAFTAVPLGEAAVAGMVAALRRSVDPDVESIDGIPPFDVATAYKLYAALLAPVERGWSGAASLIVVPHKALAELPPAVLVTAPSAQPGAGQPAFAGYKAVPWLIRRAAVSEVPSVASLALLRALPPAAAGRRPFVGFGDPWFNAAEAADGRAASGLVRRGPRSLRRRSAPATAEAASATLADLPRLPDTADEVRGVAAALQADPAADVILGDRANERTVRTMNLADRRVVMFATHGLVPGDLDGLEQPALALSAPSVAKVDGDGLLTVDKILALKLNADWVVLSACNTAAAGGAGAEAVSGLGRAFFYAGTRAVLVTNWSVETTAARTLTTDLFRRQAAAPGVARAEALRQAMLALIDGPGRLDPATGRPVFSYAHPIFWAPYGLVGDGGSG